MDGIKKLKMLFQLVHIVVPMIGLLKQALINALPPPPRTPTPTPLQKGRAIEPAPPGGAGLIARPSEAFDLDESDEQASLLGSSNNSSNRNQHSSFDALELFGQYLAEDNMIGQTLWDDGIRHAMTIDVVGNVVGPLSVKDYFSRRIRWIRARKYMSIGTTLVEPFTESVLLGIVMTLAVDRLDLTNGMSKKVVMMIHEGMYFMLDYLVYWSLLHLPLVLGALSSRWSGFKTSNQLIGRVSSR
ncbi:hypothetical protein PGT21_015562 [Puccinia graminis f. sp. tritici]|uniref:Uncharacterized protein n=1 Tax=Puccinia graminis f. sp. tritici TaxID=56615 RepID=A0A5B0NG19_PUCGR|nr:hypothetical protein PGT21_015562 [Puccinia graminis f. sp. tritici]